VAWCEDVRRDAWNWDNASWTLDWIFQGWTEGSGHRITGACVPDEDILYEKEDISCRKEKQ